MTATTPEMGVGEMLDAHALTTPGERLAWLLGTALSRNLSGPEVVYGLDMLADLRHAAAAA